MKDYAPKNYLSMNRNRLTTAEKWAAIGILIAWILIGFVDAQDPVTPHEANVMRTQK